MCIKSWRGERCWEALNAHQKRKRLDLRKRRGPSWSFIRYRIGYRRANANA